MDKMAYQEYVSVGGARGGEQVYNGHMKASFTPSNPSTHRDWPITGLV